MSPHLQTVIGQAIQYFQNGNFDESERLIKQALLVAPKNFDAIHILGVIKGLRGDHQAAGKCFESAIKINPNNNFVHFNYAKVLSEIGNDQQALAHHKIATKLAPMHMDSWLAFGKSLAKLGQVEEALSKFEFVLQHQNQSADAWLNRGIALMQLKRYQEAKDSFERALSSNMDLANGWYYRGYALLELKKYQEAIHSFKKSTELDSAHVQSYYLMGNAYTALKMWIEAVSSYGKALTLDIDHAGALNNRGYAFLELKKFQEAIQDFQRVIDLVEEAPYTFGALAYAKCRVCDWLNLNQLLEKIKSGLLEGAQVSSPFPILSFYDDPALQKRAAEIWMNDKYDGIKRVHQEARSETNGKIRIGYFSADFHEHPVAYLMAGIFEEHDKSIFEIYAFSFGPKSRSAMRHRLEKSFTHFINVEDATEEEIANLSRDMEIDIAIDLGGLTAGSRAAIFANGAAPVQVNYLGYPGTLGVNFYDYVIADKQLIQDSDMQYYSEKIAYLPMCFQPNDSNKVVDHVFKPKSEYGLPEDRFVFCCFNNSYKINSEMFEVWMNILLAVEHSVLWLTFDNEDVCINLRNEAEKRGVSTSRLIFAKRTETLSEHLARQRHADLFLDTFPFNAHTTASDALWVGLPLLTKKGATYASRVAASLLQAVDLGEMVVETDADYQALAISLACNLEKLTEIKDQLIKNKTIYSLFDTQAYTRTLEKTYLEMHQQALLHFSSGNINITN